MDELEKEESVDAMFGGDTNPFNTFIKAPLISRVKKSSKLQNLINTMHGVGEIIPDEIFTDTKKTITEKLPKLVERYAISIDLDNVKVLPYQ